MKKRDAFFLLVLGWVLIATFGIVLVGNPNPVWKAIALLGLCWMTFIVPGTLETIGLLFVRQNCYRLGKAIVRLSAPFYAILPPPQRELQASAYITLAGLCATYETGDEACRWADKALSKLSAVDTLNKFKILSAAADAYFTAGKTAEAKQFLDEALSMYSELLAEYESFQRFEVGRWLRERLTEECGEQQAHNYDLLARGLLENARIPEAKSYFERGAALRKTVPSLAPAADSYLSDALGTVSSHSGEHQPNKYLEACRKLPEELGHADTRRLALRIYRHLDFCDTVESKETKTQLGKRLGLH